MKKIILLMALVCILCTSCARIVSADYDEVFSGVISRINEKTHQIDVVNELGCVQICYSDDMEDDLLYSSTVDEDFKVGDFVYVYSDDGDTLISKVSVSDAKKINSFLIDLISWKSLGILFLIEVIFIIVAVKIVRCSFYNGGGSTSWGCFMYFCVCVFALMICYLGILCNHGFRLSHNGDGVIKEIVDNKVTLENGWFFTVISDKYMTDEESSAKVGDKVEVYQYFSGYFDEKGKASSKVVLANEKITEATIATKQTYPVTSIYFLFSLIVYLLVGAIVFSIMGVFDDR